LESRYAPGRAPAPAAVVQEHTRQAPAACKRTPAAMQGLIDALPGLAAGPGNRSRRGEGPGAGAVVVSVRPAQHLLQRQEWRIQAMLDAPLLGQEVCNGGSPRQRAKALVE